MEPIAHQNSHICLHCKKAYRYPSQLKEHMRFHENDRRFMCTHKNCNKIFFTSSGLQVHTRSHLLEEERPYRCKTCDYGFSTKQHLSAHVRVHSGETPYVCTVPGCVKKFTQDSNLKMHIRRIHTKDRPVKCSMCPYACVVNRDLVKHMKNIHNSSPVADSTTAVATETENFIASAAFVVYADSLLSQDEMPDSFLTEFS